MDLPGIGKRIRQAREAAGIDSGAELARRLGVNQTTAWRWEERDLAPDTENLVKLNDLLRVSVDHLLFGSARKRRRAA